MCQHLKNVIEFGILVRVDGLAAIGRVQGQVLGVNSAAAIQHRTVIVDGLVESDLRT